MLLIESSQGCDYLGKEQEECDKILQPHPFEDKCIYTKERVMGGDPKLSAEVTRTATGDSRQA